MWLDDRLRVGLAVLDRHTQGGGEWPGGGGVVYGPADDAAAEHVEHDCAVDLAFSGWMLGHVGHPQLVRLMADEVPLDQIRWGIHRADSPPFGSSASAQARVWRVVGVWWWGEAADLGFCGVGHGLGGDL